MTETGKRPRGRPKDDAKRTALLDAARSLFLAHGPDVTMDEVAATAGVSKATLYANFTDKNHLIMAVIRRESDITITDAEYSEFLLQSDIREVLFRFGVRYAAFINSRELLGWDRLIASLESRHPELPKRFFDLGPGRGQRLLQGLITQAIERGELRPVDAEQAADALTGLWLGFTNLEIKLGVRPPLSSAEIERRVENGIAIFMAVYAAAATPGTQG